MSLKSGEVYFSEQSGSFTIPESISLFGFSVSFFGVFLVVAALVGMIVVKEAARRKQQNTEWTLTFFTLSIVSSLLGARLYYVFFEWERFVQNPLGILNLRSGGLAYFGALFGVWFVLKWACRRKQTDFFQYADTMSIGASAAAPFVWLGCMFVREPLGKFYDGMFAMRVGTEYLPAELLEKNTEELFSNVGRIGGRPYASMHPIALYGMGMSLIIFAVLCVIGWKAKQEGTVFTVYLLLNAISMIVTEIFRADGLYVFGTEIPVNYVVAGVLNAVILGDRLRREILKRKKKNKIFPEG